MGKFRKNREYNDDYSHTHSKHRNEQVEIKKILAQHEEEEIQEQDEALSSDDYWLDS